MIAGYQTYLDYIFLKRHFNEYDFIWHENTHYGRIKETSLQKRKDYVFFKQVDDKFRTRRDRVDILVSGFLHDSNAWIGDFLNEEIEYEHYERMKRYSALESVFERDCDTIEWFLEDNSQSFTNIILTVGIETPKIINCAVCWETLALFDHFTDFMNTWFPINPLWKVRRLCLCKYKYLLRLRERDYSRIEKCYQNLARISVNAPK